PSNAVTAPAAATAKTVTRLAYALRCSRLETKTISRVPYSGIAVSKSSASGWSHKRSPVMRFNAIRRPSESPGSFTRFRTSTPIPGTSIMFFPRGNSSNVAVYEPAPFHFRDLPELLSIRAVQRGYALARLDQKNPRRGAHVPGNLFGKLLCPAQVQRLR